MQNILYQWTILQIKPPEFASSYMMFIQLQPPEGATILYLFWQRDTSEAEWEKLWMDMNAVVIICGLDRGAEGGFLFCLWKNIKKKHKAIDLTWKL